jgi:transglutaminase-like putative cysteine protease
MEAEVSRLIRVATFALMALATAATEVAAADSRAIVASLGLAGLWIAGTGLASRWAPFSLDGKRPRTARAILLVLAICPFAVEPLRRAWTGEGFPLELQMVFALRNLGFGLAALAASRAALRLATVSSLFLILFAISMTDHAAVVTLLGLYCATGSVWLMLVYWASLRRTLVTPDVGVEIQAGCERLPWLAVAVVIVLVGSALALVGVGPGRAAQALGEWLPTSGGTGGYDPFARGGVNDGDEEMEGENARSIGLTPSDTFLDSPLPTLYDMINDMYGEPFKNRDVEQAIALDPLTQVKESGKPPADNLRPNREFSTRRKSPPQPREPATRPARAIYEVEGRTPLHIRAAAFDVFDGVAWHEAPLSDDAWRLEKEPGSCWMRLSDRKAPPIFSDIESHKIKLTKPSGSLVPTPAHVTRFRLGRVDRANFFALGRERLVRMHRKTPAGFVVETECRVVNPAQLGDLVIPRDGNGDTAAYLSLPSELSPEVVELAQRWTEGRARGWPQIAAVVDSLRTDYVLDPSARAPEACADPLRHFLRDSRRGPDYQFASAAAVLLRTQGYPTRLVSGFYAAPEHYDPETRHTPVVEDDLHCWAEVMLPNGDWLVVESTSGYAVLAPRMSLSERLCHGLLAVAAWGAKHALPLSLTTMILGGLWWWRFDLLDRTAVALRAWLLRGEWHGCVRRALWLLQCRANWAGQRRSLSQTVPAWLRAVAIPADVAEGDIRGLIIMAEWASYAPDVRPPWDESEVSAVCRRLVERWTWRRWRENARAT